MLPPSAPLHGRRNLPHVTSSNALPVGSVDPGPSEPRQGPPSAWGPGRQTGATVRRAPCRRRRDRRIIINFDTISGDRNFGGRDPAELVKWKFHVIDAAGVQIDSVWWCWGEGNQSPWPSSIMPLYDSEGYRRWKEQGIDIAAIFAEESRKRGIEAFYNYRINGSDNDLGPFSKLPMKLKHPEWLIHTWPGPVGLWNYAIPEVRRYKLSMLREIAERFDYDGISLDFARVCPVLPPGKAWANRDKMNEFMREFRSITQQVAQRRGRPLLIGARIPENLEGCRFDGLDIETWVQPRAGGRAGAGHSQLRRGHRRLSPYRGRHPRQALSLGG